MMDSQISLGSAPYSEPCVQVMTGEDYVPAMKAECRRYKKQLEAMFPIPDGVEACFRIVANQHDFGVYYDVVVEWQNRAGADFAYMVDEKAPADWMVDENGEMEDGTIFKDGVPV